jgi:hypothetical protein
MPDRRPGLAVEEHRVLANVRTTVGWTPFKESVAEAILPEGLKEECPGEGVERLRQVKLQEDPWRAEVLQQLGGLSHQHEVVV